MEGEGQANSRSNSASASASNSASDAQFVRDSKTAIAAATELTEFLRLLSTNVEGTLVGEVARLKAQLKAKREERERAQGEVQAYEALLGGDSQEGDAGILKGKLAMEKLDQCKEKHARDYALLQHEREKRLKLEAEVERLRGKVEKVRAVVASLKHQQQQEKARPLLNTLVDTDGLLVAPSKAPQSME